MTQASRLRPTPPRAERSRDTPGQNQWRYCGNCQGLWFSGNGGQGRCPAPAGLHDPGTDDYFV